MRQVPGSFVDVAPFIARQAENHLAWPFRTDCRPSPAPV